MEGFMETPQDKYETDPAYKMFVDYIEATIHSCQFTPSEVRAGALLACIHFEMKSFQRNILMPKSVSDSLRVLDEYRSGMANP